jgi:hypothetical protein
MAGLPTRDAEAALLPFDGYKGAKPWGSASRSESPTNSSASLPGCGWPVHAAPTVTLHADVVAELRRVSGS